jgi:putative tryptophan/tyrosine transport system substrate-binding protein
VAWPLAVRAQQAPVPVVGFIHGGVADALAHLVVAFRKGLSETGYVERQNITVEYHWLEGQFNRLPALVADLVRRRVAVIAACDHLATLAAKAATTTIPIVFLATEDPVKLGFVASLARPGGNLTGTNTFSTDAVSKKLGLLHQLLPKAVSIAVLINPLETTNAETTVRDAQDAASLMGLQIQVHKASTSREIDDAFAAMAHERPDALFIGNDAFFASRNTQFLTLAARDRIPAAYSDRVTVAAGGLMSYGTSFAEAHRRVGVYTGSILKGAKPAELPVIQPTKFEFIINLQAARALGIEVPPPLLALANEVIE